MPNFDLDEFLNRKHYAFSFQALLGDVEDFLEFSEHNIEWQHRREIQSICTRKDLDGYPEGYEDHLLTNAEHRFTVSLPMRIRYAALVALITTVEWEAKFLSERAVFAIGRVRKGTNETVHVLRRFNKMASLGSDAVIRDYERLVIVRNAIVHSAGVERAYKYRRELKISVEKLHGFSITNWHFIGDCVKIERGALAPYIQAMAKLLPQAWERADQLGSVKT